MSDLTEADRTFEELGYEKIKNTKEEYLCYHKNKEWSAFAEYYFIFYYGDTIQMRTNKTIITAEEMKAVCKKCYELGIRGDF